MNETRIYLPFRTKVLVQLFGSASYRQKGTFKLQNVQQPIVREGSQSDNKEFARFDFDTGQPVGDEKSFLVTVGIQYQPAPIVPWRDSRAMPSRPCSAAAFTAQFIASEDSGDGDWNDCLVMFTWKSPFVSEGEGAEAAEGAG